MSHDQSRRDDIVRRTLQGLEEDLDDLREELGRQFEDYEGRLEAITAELPDWLELEPGALRAVFGFSYGEEGLRLGPRVVAFAAGRVEQALESFASLEVEGLEASRQVLLDELADLEGQARACALDADAFLGDTLDTILTQLQERRESDEYALRELVTTGDVDRGSDAREEIAGLWEEQRRRARKLRQIWEPLEALVFEGVDLTVTGIAELRAMVHRAVEGLGGAPVEDSSGVPGGLTVDEVSRVTEKILKEASTDEWDRDVATVEADREPGEATADAPKEAWEATDPDLGPTARVDITALAKKDGRSKPPPAAAVPPVVRARTETVEEHHTEPPPALVVRSADDSGTFESETRGMATRTVEEWASVSWVEGVLVSLPIVLVVLTGGLATVPTLAGARPSLDVHGWMPWLFPWGFVGGALIWVALMVWRRWRLCWSDGPRLVRWRERDEEVEVTVDRQGIRVGEVRYPKRQLTAKVVRWETGRDGDFGFAVVLRPRTSESVTFAAVERNFTRWDQAPDPVTSIDLESWVTTPTVLEAIRQRMGV